MIYECIIKHNSHELLKHVIYNTQYLKHVDICALLELELVD